MDPNPNLSPAVCHQPSLLGGAENMKLLFDDTMASMAARRSKWDTLDYQIAHDAQVVKHLAQLNVVIAGQSGDTANQQTVSPVRTAAGDNLAAGAAPANRVVDETGAVASGAVDAAIAGIATANQAIADALAKLADATNAVLIAATGLAAGNAAAPKAGA